VRWGVYCLGSLPGVILQVLLFCHTLFLQGSTVQREASPKEKKKEFPTFKDNDFVKDNVKIYLNEEDREEFLSKLKSDVDVSINV